MSEATAAVPKLTKLGFRLEPTFELVEPEQSIWGAIQRSVRVDAIAMTLGLTRKVSHVRFVPPTAEDLAEYARLEAMFEEVQASRFWLHGYDGGYLQEPRTRREVVWAETEDEYEERVLATYEQYERNIQAARVETYTLEPGAFGKAADLTTAIRVISSALLWARGAAPLDKSLESTAQTVSNQGGTS